MHAASFWAIRCRKSACLGFVFFVRRKRETFVSIKKNYFSAGVNGDVGFESRVEMLVVMGGGRGGGVCAIEVCAGR